MPVTTLSGLQRMAELAPRTRFPACLLRAAQAAKRDEAALRQVGVEHTLAQAADLLENGVDGLHFYTLNQSSPTLEILKELPMLVPAVSVH
jgi:methylenetetrahydrofolate reductase (NADPH)